MKRQEAREAAKVMMAYADGKEIEFLNSLNEWIFLEDPMFN